MRQDTIQHNNYSMHGMATCSLLSLLKSVRNLGRRLGLAVVLFQLIRSNTKTPSSNLVEDLII